MKCIKCGHKWKRSSWKELISGYSKCPECGSRWVLKGIFGKMVKE